MPAESVILMLKRLYVRPLLLVAVSAEVVERPRFLCHHARGAGYPLPLLLPCWTDASHPSEE